MPELPLPKSQAQKWWAGVAAIVVCAVLYTGASLLTRDRAVLIPQFDWETAIPFWPQTVWIYLAQYPMLVIAFSACRDLARCGRFLYAAVIVQVLAATIFVLYPIQIPRPALPLAGELDAITSALASAVHSVDAPVNCFPSLHVTSCLLCLWLIARERAWLVWCFAIASTLCIASTLTFKQHYFIDLPAGAVLAAVGWWMAGRLCLPRAAAAA
jgi:membrane-associated phospholipid phosphatase